jgi:hypothetical protein
MVFIGENTGGMKGRKSIPRCDEGEKKPPGGGFFFTY